MGLQGFLLPGEEMNIQFTILVHPAIAAPLNLKIQKLSTLLIIHTILGQDLFLELDGEYGTHAVLLFRSRPSHRSYRTNVLRYPPIRVGPFARPNPRTERDKGPTLGTTSAQLVARVHKVDWLANESRRRDCRTFLIHHSLGSPDMTSFSTICSLPQETESWRYKYARFVGEIAPGVDLSKAHPGFCCRVWTLAQISLHTLRQRHRTRLTPVTHAQSPQCSLRSSVRCLSQSCPIPCTSGAAKSQVGMRRSRCWEFLCVLW
jgi:hypothetical protein